MLVLFLIPNYKYIIGISQNSNAGSRWGHRGAAHTTAEGAACGQGPPWLGMGWGWFMDVNGAWIP